MSGYYTDPFWDYLYQLRQTGVLCDIQLFVKNQQDEFVSIFAHKVILAASSYYFQSCLSQGELLDIYNFDGIHVDNLQIVLDYMYHQISWSELQSNAEATIAAKTLGIMEQTSPPDPVLDRSVLKDTDGNKVLLVKRFSTGRKANSNGAAKTSSMSKRVILPHEEIAKLIVNRRNTKPSPQARLGKLGMDELGDHGNNEGPDGTVNTIRLVEIPREEGEMMNLEESPQQAMFDSDPAPSNLPLHSPNHHVNTVVVDQQGIVTMYAQEVGEIRPGEADAGCQHTALLQGVEDPKPCDQHCEQQLASLSSEKEQMFLSVSSEQESVLADGHSDRTPEAADQDCHEVTTGITGSDIITGDTDIPTGANAEDEMIAAIVDDVSEDQIQSGDATPAISGDVEIPTASIDNAVTLQTVSSGEDCKTDVRRQALGDGDITVTYHDDNLKVNKTPKPVEIETESVPPDDDRPAAQKKQPTTGRAVGKQRLHREKATNLTHIDTPTRSRRIRRPPSDKIYEWSLPSMRRHDNEPTKVPSEVSNVEAPVESSTKEPARQTRTRLRVVVKKETESNSGTAPSKDTSEGAELVMSLGDGEKTMTRTRSKRKAILLELEEVPGNGNGGNKKTKVVPEEEESDDMSPAMQTVSTRISKDAEDDTPEGTPVIPVKRRRGRPKIKKEIKMEQLEDSNESESDAIRRSLAESNIQMESNSGPCVCSWCGKVFKNNTGLCIHENWVHKGLGQREGSTTHECTICNKVCKSFAALRNHEMQKHKMEREWPCETCGDIFRKAKELKKHRMREHKEERYECDVCQAMFISREGWKIHMYKQHTDAKPCHMCEVCGKVFKMKHELKIHCKITHSTRRDFACQLCERSFKNNVTLTRHLLTYHSNVRNYHCDVCNRAFKTNMDMKKHRERHFRENDPLTKEGKRVRKHPDGLDYPCQFCGKVFYKRYLATAHENLQHRQKDQGVSYTCTVCNKVFPIKHYLMQHISNKHRPRRFKCLRCQREFAQQYELRKHQQQPGRCQGRPDFMKPYECEHCGRKFTLKGNLTKHMQAAGRCKRVHQAQVIDYIVVVEQDGDAEPAGHASEESLETAEALATLQTAQALQLLQNPETQHTSSELPGNQEMQMLQELDGTVVMEESEAGEGALGEAQGMGEEDMGTMLHITDGEGGDGQVHILEIHPGEGNEQTQQIEISEELVAQLGGTQENIIVQIVPADRQGAQGYEETR